MTVCDEKVKGFAKSYQAEILRLEWVGASG